MKKYLSKWRFEQGLSFFFLERFKSFRPPPRKLRWTNAGCSGRSGVMEISIGALDAGAQDHRSGGAARGAGARYRVSRRAICPVKRVIWAKFGLLVAMATAEPFGVPRLAASDQATAEAGVSGSWSHGLRSGESRMKISRPGDSANRSSAQSMTPVLRQPVQVARRRGPVPAQA